MKNRIGIPDYGTPAPEAGVFCCIPYRRADRGQAGCGMTAMSEREFRAAIVTVGMSVLPAVCQILRSGKAGWCEKNIWYNLCSLNDRPHGSGRAVEAETEKEIIKL